MEKVVLLPTPFHLLSYTSLCLPKTISDHEVTIKK